MKKLLSIIMLLAVIVLPINLGGCTIDNFTVELDENFYFYESEEQNNNNIVVNCNDDNVICKYTCELGRFESDNVLPENEIEKQANQQVTWDCHIIESPGYPLNKDYITITLFKGKNVVGYAVIKIVKQEDTNNYKTAILMQEVFSFPKKETEVQNMARQIIKNDSKNNFVQLMHWFHTSGVINNAITVAFQDKDISCKYSCEKGRFFDGVNIDANNIHKVDTIVNKTVWWSYYNEEMEFVYNDYISILLLNNNNVVGYAVIKINCESSTRYQASILKQEMLDVPILETKALQLIENIKNKEGDNY